MASPNAAESQTYPVNCHSCRQSFDAMGAAWCSCLVSQRSLVCSACGACFCKAPPSYKQKFWSAAPKQMWERNFEEHHVAFTPRIQPSSGAVVRPLVLVVDDERDIQRIASRAIESLGYGVILGRTGWEGLELARRYLPDLVLTDALMPLLDGREMCRKIKEDPQTAGLKVVVMTGLYTKPNYRTEGLRYFRADDYLSKPLEFAELRSLLHKHLGC
jgi:CheY-like chemotaxis protein